MLADRERRLLPLLVRAESMLRALGSASIWSSYASGPAIADFIASARLRIEAGTVDETTGRELWGIFAPTCDWDDIIGDVALGEAIFEIVDALYGPRQHAG